MEYQQWKFASKLRTMHAQFQKPFNASTRLKALPLGCPTYNTT